MDGQVWSPCAGIDRPFPPVRPPKNIRPGGAVATGRGVADARCCVYALGGGGAEGFRGFRRETAGGRHRGIVWARRIRPRPPCTPDTTSQPQNQARQARDHLGQCPCNHQHENRARFARSPPSHLCFAASGGALDCMLIRPRSARAHGALRALLMLAPSKSLALAHGPMRASARRHAHATPTFFATSPRPPPQTGPLPPHRW